MKRVRRRGPGLRWLLIGLCLAGGPAPGSAVAQTQSAERPPSRAPADGDDAGPSLDFLEYLGTWESGNGEWLDPLQLPASDWTTVSDEPPGAKDAEIDNAN